MTQTIQEAMEFQREAEARRAGVPLRDIEFSRRSGMDARDVRVMREFTATGYLIVVRCPKPTARAWHGLLPPKPISVKDKSGTSGVAVPKPGYMRVSDYDLMCLCRQEGGKWRKVFASAANGAPRGKYTAEAVGILKQLNQKLVSRIQHGCQDDFCSAKNPGVRETDHFAAFFSGHAEYKANRSECKRFYEQQKLIWLYGANGEYLVDVAKKVLGQE